MAKSRKKTVAQQVVGTAALGLPAPVRSVVATRWGAPLAVLVLLAMLGTGIATLDWSNGWPKLKIDRERAQEVRQNVRERVGAASGHPSEAHTAENRPAVHLGFGQPQAESHDGEKKTIGARIFKNR